MFSFIDCTHWPWKNCSTWQQDVFLAKDGLNIMVMEVIAKKDLLMWHCFTRILSSNNDINVIDKLSLLVNVLKRVKPDVSFEVNDNPYKML
jgi:hypothetical protein